MSLAHHMNDPWQTCFQKTMEKSQVLMEKLAQFLWSCSIAMLNYQRVFLTHDVFGLLLAPT